MPMDEENTIARKTIHEDMWNYGNLPINEYKGRKSSAGDELTNHFF